jgi:hypothetical protein
MAFPFQDVQNFRGGLKLLFVVPLLGFFYYLNRIRQYLCYVHTNPALVIGSSRNACARRRDFGTCGALSEARPFG